MEENRTVAVIGNGSWATALVKILSENDLRIKWWVRIKEDIDHIKNTGYNPRYLSNAKIDLSKVSPIFDIKEVVKDCGTIILAVPSAFIKDTIAILNPDDFDGKMVVSAIKGLIPDEHKVVTDHVSITFDVPEEKLCVIGGPCHSEEVSMERKSYLTIAGINAEVTSKVASMLTCRYVKASIVDDPYGVEYSAIMKNIIAIACGIAHGLRYGDNFQAVLVSNAMQEMKRFIDAVDPRPERDLNGSAYLGDLLVTSYSQFSRNRTFGQMLGRGYSVKTAQMEMNMIAEGYYAVKSLYAINQRFGVDMPITNAVYRIAYEKIAPSVEFRILENLLK
ncbi:MAG: NAD(P)H-dependent glycerol-3-phosphate dehydrogenase [Cytophagaceae bacterium]